MSETHFISEEISLLTKIMVDTIHPEQIYLFGSFARGDQTDESDYDFYIVMNDEADKLLEVTRSVRRAIRTHKTRPVDLIVSRYTKFKEKTSLPTLERTIIDEGVLLYG